MTTRIPVVLAGATGRTGKEVGRAIFHASDMELIGALAHRHAGMALGILWGEPAMTGFYVSESLSSITADRAVLVDFTEAESAYGRLIEAVERGWDIVVGTTGFSSRQRETLAYLVEKHQVGAALIANFSLGAWVLEKLAEDASRYFSQAEVLEAHVDTKRDRPSGTARRMAELLGRALKRDPESIPVHSIRLPGMVAHQTVVFGASGQVVSIRHDVHDRSAYAAGVLAAIRKVRELRGHVVTDLGEVLDPERGL